MPITVFTLRFEGGFALMIRQTEAGAEEQYKYGSIYVRTGADDKITLF